MVSRQAATGFSGSGTLKAEAFKEATDFCSKRSQMLQVVSTHEASPPYILANFPKAEVQFMCLDTKDAELGRPKLHKEPDTIVEVKQPVVLPHDSDKPRDLYGELIKLDELRKKGLISDAEFDAQKAKLLAAQ